MTRGRISTFICCLMTIRSSSIVKDCGRKTACLLCCLFLLSENPVFAQTNAETNAGIQFNFSTPGAHSLAVGGAFLALADDASAAYTNPAGLTEILDTGVTVEARGWSYSHIFTDRGRLAGELTGVGLDTIVGLEDGVAKDDVTGLSFFSLVYPRKRWSVALYRHELANFDANFEAQGAFVADSARLLPTRTVMNLDIVSHGFSAAYRVSGNLSLGLGFSYYDFAINSTTQRFATRRDTGGICCSLDYSSGNSVSSQIQLGEDTNWGLIAGFLWKISDFWSAGGVLRQGPSFEFAAKDQPGPRATSSSIESEQRARFHTPDVIGIGIAFKPNDTIRLTLDYDQVQYSDLTASHIDIFNAESTGNELAKFKVDDADEIHLGVEYIFIYHEAHSIALRLGAWHDPDHRIRFEGESAGFRALFRRGNDALHVTGGVGVGSRTFQVDAAFDQSDRVTTVSLSTTIRF